MGSRVLLGVNLDSDICKHIRDMQFSCLLHIQADKFKVLDLDTMLVEDVGIGGLDDLIDYEPCIDDQGFIDVKIDCKRSQCEFICLSSIGNGDYLVFSGDELVSEESYLIMYSFYNFDLIFNAIDCTYSIKVFNKYNLTEYSYEVFSSGGCRGLEDIEFSSVSSFCEKIDAEIYLVNDCLIVNKLKKCIILPNKAKKVLFVGYGWTEDLEYNIVIPPSVEHIEFDTLFWTDRVNCRRSKYLQIALPSSNFDKLHKNVTDSIMDNVKRKSVRTYSLILERIVTLYDNGDLPDEELDKLLDDLNIKIIKY